MAPSCLPKTHTHQANQVSDATKRTQTHNCPHSHAPAVAFEVSFEIPLAGASEDAVRFPRQQTEAVEHAQLLRGRKKRYNSIG